MVSEILIFVCLFSCLGTAFSDVCAGRSKSPDGRRCIFHLADRNTITAAYNFCKIQGGTVFMVLSSREKPWIQSQLRITSPRAANDRYWYSAYRVGGTTNPNHVFNTKDYATRLVTTANLNAMYSFQKSSVLRSRCSHVLTRGPSGTGAYDDGFRFSTSCNLNNAGSVLCQISYPPAELEHTQQAFKIHRGKKPDTPPIATSTAPLKECIKSCIRTYYCFGFVHNPAAAQQCQLIARILDDIDNLNSDVNWDYYELKF